MACNEIQGGYVKLYRRSLENGWLRNHKMWVFWTYCLLKATHKKRKHLLAGSKQITLSPGQFIFGRKRAAEETGLSEQEVRTCLKNLKKLDNVTVRATNRYSIITICNWSVYQDYENEDQPTEPPADQPTVNQRLTSNQPAPNHRQECKNVKNVKKKNNNVGSENERKVLDNIFSFEKAWKLYPRLSSGRRAGSKKKACEQFEKHIDTSGKRKDFKKSLENYAKENPEYPKHMFRWIKDEDWKNYIEEVRPRKKKAKRGKARWIKAGFVGPCDKRCGGGYYYHRLVYGNNPEPEREVIKCDNCGHCPEVPEGNKKNVESLIGAICNK